MNRYLLNSYMPVKVISGKDCVVNSSSEWKTAGKKCLLVTGKHSAKTCGALQDVLDVLNECNIDYLIYDNIQQNPLVEDCFAAGQFAREANVDFIVGIGGGSVLDASKAIAIFAANEFFDAMSIYSRQIPSKRLPLLLIGTTAGTGSEVTGVSVLTDVNGFKKSISGTDCYADVSFCDSKYTHTSNYDVTVSTALDAYAHALESYFAATSNDLSSLYAEKALGLLWKNLKYLSDHKICEISSVQREELYAASIYAGMSINITGTAFPHTAGYILTELYGISHGKACTAFHPQLLDKAEKYRPEQFEAVCRLFAADKSEINALIGKLTSVHISVSREEAVVHCSRWTSAVRNFDRSPGGYTADEAVEGLLSLNKH